MAIHTVSKTVNPGSTPGASAKLIKVFKMITFYMEAPADTDLGDMKIASVFLAGGIDKAPNWQKEIVSMFNERKVNVALYNPRRKKEITAEEYANHMEQVSWEFKNLRKADLNLFWFPENAPCTTSLFELGYWLGKEPEKVLIGINPGHYKESGIKTQLELLGSKIQVASSLEELVGQVEGYIDAGEFF